MIDLILLFPELLVSATLARFAGGQYAGGEWVPGAASTSVIQIIKPQPVASDELDPLPQGERVKDFLKTWSVTELQTRDGGEDSDRLTLGGKVYKVVSVEDRDLEGGYHKVIIKRVF